MSAAVSMASIHSASCSTLSAMLLSHKMSLSAAAIFHTFAASFLLSSDIPMTSYLMTSWLVPMVLTFPAGSTRSHTITSCSDGIASSSSITYVSSAPMSGVVCPKSMIEVIFLHIGLVAFPNSLFRIRSYLSTSCSNPTASLLSPQCTFQSGLWVLKSTSRTTLPLICCPSTRLVVHFFFC